MGAYLLGLQNETRGTQQHSLSELASISFSKGSNQKRSPAE
uniref:Uncharacterized protein n=1 Tax=Arundo donax TaxID=35708 RepID=A0A0A8ZAH3_ARUDO